jgi:hypothetical protein
MKSCLFRYIATAVHRPEESLTGHSAEWESWCIYHLFLELGYQIDAINWKDKNFRITKQYDVVFDAINLIELKSAYKNDTIGICHLTGADNIWRNEAGEKRLTELNERRGVKLGYRRKIENPEQVYKCIEFADYVTLIGNAWTRSTYPEKYRDKIHLVNVSATKG